MWENLINKQKQVNYLTFLKIKIKNSIMGKLMKILSSMIREAHDPRH